LYLEENKYILVQQIFQKNLDQQEQGNDKMIIFLEK